MQHAVTIKKISMKIGKSIPGFRAFIVLHAFGFAQIDLGPIECIQISQTSGKIKDSVQSRDLIGSAYETSAWLPASPAACLGWGAAQPKQCVSVSQ